MWDDKSYYWPNMLVTLREAAAAGPGIVVVDAETPLRRLIELQRDTGHPVLLCDGGAFCGLCGPEEVIGALAGGHGAPGQADAAN